MQNTLLYLRCLCRDIGCYYIPDKIEYVTLDRGKKLLLRAAESRFGVQSELDELNDWIDQNLIDFDHFHIDEFATSNVLEKVRDLYQITSFLLKQKKAHTQEHEDTYIEAFEKNESITRFWRRDTRNEVTRIARQIIRRATLGLDLSPRAVARGGRHGPGATLKGESKDSKCYFDPIPDNMATYYGSDFLCKTENFGYKSRTCVPANDSASLRSEKNVECRLTLVPKTWKGPRGVFISPKEAMICQLGCDYNIKMFCKNNLWYRESIDYDDQTPSKELSLRGSIFGDIATLDLSDASDRLPLSLVCYLFHRNDYLALACCRPTHAWLPNGKKHRLSMFAPMGDGKTFSVLSVVCCTLSVAAILAEQGFVSARKIPFDKVLSAFRLVRVFGDDIIVPKDYFEAVVRGLESNNLLVNKNKSFVNGRFRESCGMDAYLGVDVTPVRLKIDPSSFSVKNDYQSLLDLHNRVVLNYGRFDRLRLLLRADITQVNPLVPLTTDVSVQPFGLYERRSLVLQEYLLRKRAVRYNAFLYCIEALCSVYVENTKCTLDSLDSRWSLNQWYWNAKDEAIYDGDVPRLARITSGKEVDRNDCKVLRRIFPKCRCCTRWNSDGGSFLPRWVEVR